MSPEIESSRFGEAPFPMGAPLEHNAPAWKRPGQSAADLLQKAQKQLAMVSSSTEGSFLKTGESLMELQSKARQISSQTASISELLLNDNDSLAVLDEIQGAAIQGYQDDEVLSRTEEVEASARAIHTAIQQTDPMVGVFYLLGVKTRVESVQFSGHGESFANLADAVTALSRKIRDVVNASEDSAAVLLAAAADAAMEVRGMARKHQENLGPLIRQTSTELENIKHHQTRLSEAAQKRAQSFDRVSQALGDVVCALQSHDIVRQQIEHVLAALNGIDSSALESPASASVLRIQAAQLSHSKTTFAKSVRQIHESLREIQQNIEEITEDSAEVSSMPGSGERSMAARANANLGGILAILESDQALDDRLLGVAAGIQERVAEISRLIAGLQAIGTDMQHTALNAIFQAAQLGSEGATLRTIADTIRIQAKGADNIYSTLDRQMSSIQTAASALEKAFAARGASADQVSSLRRNIAAVTSRQEQTQRENLSAMELAAELKRQIAETVDGFGMQEECSRLLGDAADLLHHLSGEENLTDHAGLEWITASYTMHSERATHENACGIAPVTDGTLPGQDDNVEFF